MILSPTFKHKKGKTGCTSGQARVMLLLEMLGKEVRTHLPSSQIESTVN